MTLARIQRLLDAPLPFRGVVDSHCFLHTRTVSFYWVVQELREIEANEAAMELEVYKKAGVYAVLKRIEIWQTNTGKRLSEAFLGGSGDQGLGGRTGEDYEISGLPGSRCAAEIFPCTPRYFCVAAKMKFRILRTSCHKYF